MTKQDFIARLADRMNISKQAARGILNSVISEMKDVVMSEGELKLPEFGVFQFRVTAERKGRNVHTGEIRVIPPKRTFHFRISKTLKDELNLSNGHI